MTRASQVDFALFVLQSSKLLLNKLNVPFALLTSNVGFLCSTDDRPHTKVAYNLC